MYHVYREQQTHNNAAAPRGEELPSSAKGNVRASFHSTETLKHSNAKAPPIRTSSSDVTNAIISEEEEQQPVVVIGRAIPTRYQQPQLEDYPTAAEDHHSHSTGSLSHSEEELPLIGRDVMVMHEHVDGTLSKGAAPAASQDKGLFSARKKKPLPKATIISQTPSAEKNEAKKRAKRSSNNKKAVESPVLDEAAELQRRREHHCAVSSVELAMKLEAAIPAEFHMISGSKDMQTSADVFHTGHFRLPNPTGKAGGACTSALLRVLYALSNERTNQLNNRAITGEAIVTLSWVECLRTMWSMLREMGYAQVPQLTSSRLIDVNKPMNIVPPDFKVGKNHKRAILIGINYVGQVGELTGCHNDVGNVKNYLVNEEGFDENEMLILMDDQKHHSPTRKNIEDAFRRMTEYSHKGDVVFIHYSGHGRRIVDTSGDEDDGYDETLIPLDYKKAGQIVDDDILQMLVKPMPAGVTVTVLVDCCHSGTALDLPYRFSADDSEMHVDQGFQMERFLRKMGKGGNNGVACGCLPH